jgi:homospermidine synthase
VDRVTIIDFQDKSEDLEKFTICGLTYIKEKIAQENINDILSKYVKSNDILVDLGYSIDCNDIVKWCHDNSVMYLNTSTEVWDTEDLFGCTIDKKSLYYRHHKLQMMINSWNKNSTTAIIEHGANPGLISSFVKQGLVDIANQMLCDSTMTNKNSIIDILSKNEKIKFPLLARLLGVKVIHCSERDTQITNKPKLVDEFVGTWSLEGFREEGTACAELGWGTHEDAIPLNAYVPEYGDKNKIFLAKMGINVNVKSWVPNQNITGMLVRHGEAYTISKYLTVSENNKIVYRPTVHYVYLPCDSTIASLQEFRCNNYKMQSKLRIMNNEIVSGEDRLGALIMGHKYNSWWTGSILDINSARKLVKHQSATTVQVAIGAIAAILWMIDNPNKGVCVPEDLPYEYVLKIAKPYLGKFVSTESSWTPVNDFYQYFKENPSSQMSKNMWSFENFICKE